MGAVYEGFLLFGPLLVIGFIYSVITDYNDQASPALEAMKRLGLQAVISVSVLAYFTWGWSKGRCTLPMQTLGLRVQLRNGADLSAQQAAIRALAAFPSTFLLIGFLWAIFDRDSQTLHDRLLGTRLVHIPVSTTRASAQPDQT